MVITEQQQYRGPEICCRRRPREKKYFFVARSPLWQMAQPQMEHQHSAVRKRQPEAVYGSKQETFIGRDTTSSRVTLKLKCAANIYFWRRAQIFLLLMLQNLWTRGNLTQVAFFDGVLPRLHFQICNYPKCIRPYLHLEAGQFQICYIYTFFNF